ncbi:unnamed protein product [Nezara viridula]|uniref:Uncharacterized protein n=1 Tax=Nezara viridula TaxID=85310 RepID=A0A9P0E5F1_NEZVI|nr:unnamed protein product [Nezara viridula]
MGKEVLHNGSLYIHPFPSSELREEIHKTSYRCIASNPVGQILSRECKLRPDHVTEAIPQIKEDSETLTAKAGSAIDLLCVAQGAPPPTYR